jgi:hypothetical protein
MKEERHNKKKRRPLIEKERQKTRKLGRVSSESLQYLCLTVHVQRTERHEWVAGGHLHQEGTTKRGRRTK